MSSMQARCRVFSYDEIKKATNNFEKKTGEGGEGKVYKGRLSDGQNMIDVAVKCLKSNSNELRKEIDMLSNLHHANLVSLIGYCQQKESKLLLVYELMANGSLYDSIYKEDGCSLAWKERLKICIGAARGLEYLHTGTSTVFKIIHRDVKPSNILLDENFNAKISDFGLSRRGPANQTRSAVTTALKGTKGYYAPEYLKTGQITIKVDVYAFGLVLFEVLCRETSWERIRDDTNVEDQNIRQWASENFDKFLDGGISKSSFEVFIDIAEKCLNQEPSQRPTMSEVASKLEIALKLQESESKAGAMMLQRSDLRTTESDKATKTSRERASGSSQPTTQSIGRTESSSTKSKVESQLYKSLPTIQDNKITRDVATSGEITYKTMPGSSMNPSGSTLIIIPGTERKIVLYSSVQTHTDCFKIRLYLNVYKVIIEERDPTINGRYEAELRGFFSRTGRQYSLPQLFIGGKYIGGADEVDRLYCSGQLRELLEELNQV